MLFSKQLVIEKKITWKPIVIGKVISVGCFLDPKVNKKHKWRRKQNEIKRFSLKKEISEPLFTRSSDFGKKYSRKHDFYGHILVLISSMCICHNFCCLLLFVDGVPILLHRLFQRNEKSFFTRCCHFVVKI